MAMPSVTHVRGDTLSLGGIITGLPAGTWTATAQLREPDNSKLADLTATLTAPVNPGDPWTLLIELAAAAVDQSTWPLGTAYADVRVNEASSGTVYHTTTFGVIVTAPITVPT